MAEALDCAPSFYFFRRQADLPCIERFRMEINVNEIVMFNMSDIYKTQTIYEEICAKEAQGHVHILDMTQMRGVDCYCDEQSEREIAYAIRDFKPEGIHFIDNGNYHYISKLWLDKVEQPCILLVFDHHPDMQEPVFGPILSCGSWVKNVLDENQWVHHVALVGVDGALITDQMHDYDDRVTFITKQQLGAAQEEQIKNGKALLAAVLADAECAADPKEKLPVYISIDKDVLDVLECRTNWNQGGMKINAMLELLAFVIETHQVIGMDICGEMDRKMESMEGAEWNQKNSMVNKRLMNLIKFINNLEKK